MWMHVAPVIARARFLYLNDIGPKICQHLRGIGTGEQAREIEYTYTVEWQAHHRLLCPEDTAMLLVQGNREWRALSMSKVGQGECQIWHGMPGARPAHLQCVCNVKHCYYNATSCNVSCSVHSIYSYLSCFF